MLNPIDQMIAEIPLWIRLVPALLFGLPLMWGVWATRDRVK